MSTLQPQPMAEPPGDGTYLSEIIDAATEWEYADALNHHGYGVSAVPLLGGATMRWQARATAGENTHVITAVTDQRRSALHAAARGALGSAALAAHIQAHAPTPVAHDAEQVHDLDVLADLAALVVQANIMPTALGASPHCQDDASASDDHATSLAEALEQCLYAYALRIGVPENGAAEWSRAQAGCLIAEARKTWSGEDMPNE